MVKITSAGNQIDAVSGQDTNDYEKYFGQKDYFLYDDRLLIVVLDNSRRSFSDETLEILSLALKTERDNIIEVGGK